MKDPAVRDKMQEAWDILSSFGSHLTNFGAIRGGGRHRKSFEEFKKDDKFLIHAVFKDRETLRTCLEKIKEKDLGLSVTVSGLFNEAKKTCREAGLTPHTVQYSLGVLGKTDLLPEERVLEITTMCGHAMVSPNLIAHLIERVGRKKMTLTEAALELSRQCECGIFNPARAERLLREMI
jgi:hypothetical protein